MNDSSPPFEPALEDLRGGLDRDTFRAALLRGREAWLATAVRFLLDGPGGAIP